MENKIQLSKKDRMSVALRHQFLQGSWNYERMQNGGWAFSMIPAIKKLYPNKEDQVAALKRHLEFYNTHPYVSAPVNPWSTWCIYCSWRLCTWPHSLLCSVERHPSYLPVVHPGVWLQGRRFNFF